MRGGRGSNGAPTDLLVCFPSRAHLALMPPKPTCSPARPGQEPIIRHRRSTSYLHGGATPSPLFRSARLSKHKTFTNHSKNTIPMDDEPTSPKVTCAGQIKCRTKKPDDRPVKKKKTAWLDVLGLKKEALPFLNALHGLRFNMSGCFGGFPDHAVDYSSEEEEEVDELEVNKEEMEVSDALSKWFMALEEGRGKSKKLEAKQDQLQDQQPVLQEAQEEEEEEEVVVPPKNALLLMRCRSAPASRWLAREEEGEEEEEEVAVVSLRKTRDEEKEKERLVLMSYAPDFFKVSMDIAKETWVVGNGDDNEDVFSRCRSWKR